MSTDEGTIITNCMHEAVCSSACSVASGSCSTAAGLTVSGLQVWKEQDSLNLGQPDPVTDYGGLHMRD